jgi:NADH-quinone oxidoreductase subunit E
MASTTLGPILAPFERRPEALIPLLQAVQEHLGYLPPEALQTVARHARVPRSRVYGVASFYKAFHLTPRGKHLVRVCLGTACHVRGGQRVIEEIERRLNVEVGETTKDLNFTLERVNCLGCCALGPIVMIDEDYYGPMSPAKVGSLLKRFH